MGVFDFFRKSGIDAKVKELKEYPEAVLLDVRREDEYSEGHIPGAVNIPLQKLEEIKIRITDRKKKLYVYCLSGGRSHQACERLEMWGYEDVTNIGGISGYNGPIEK